jgi:VCBS repeat-containing protein
LSDWFAQAEGVNRIEFCDGSTLDRLGIERLMNQPPVANADAITVFEDGGVMNIATAALLANDTDPNPNDVLSVVSVGTSAVAASVTLNNGQIQYDIGNRFQELGAGQTLTDSFDYTITDNNGATASSVVNVTITGVNDAPVTTADDATALQEDTALAATGNVLSNDSDVDQGTVLTVANAGVFAGQYGQLTLQTDGSYSYDLDNAALSVQSLAQGQTVTERFAYQATDGIALTPSTLIVTITGTNDAPVVATPLRNQSVQQASAFNFTLPANAFSDIDTGDILTYTATLADPTSTGSGQVALPSWITFNPATRVNLP